MFAHKQHVYFSVFGLCLDGHVLFVYFFEKTQNNNKQTQR